VPLPATQQVGAETSSAFNLLQLEGEARNSASVAELAHLIANDTARIVRAQQTFVFKTTVSGVMQIAAVSSVTTLDRQVPLLQALERVASRVAADAGGQAVREFALQAHADANGADQSINEYPYREALWFALSDRQGKVFAGVLLVRGEPWTANDVVLARRLSVTFAQAWYWIATAKALSPWGAFNRKHALLGALAVAVIGIVPVPLTALAPLEVTPRNPILVTSPIDGVIEDIPVAANGAVAAGDVLVRFSDTVLRNRRDVAEREVQVADSRVKKTMLLAVSDMRSRHELALASAELKVKIAERDYARDLLARTVVTAQTSGRVIVADKRDLIGRPVSTGERIMEVATPAQVEVRIDVATSDAIVLSDSRRVKLFLDSDPLNARAATVLRTDYQAKTTDAGTLAFRVIAQLDDDGQPPPRLGIRGTAQLYGDRVPLIYYALRRPITALRQWIGL
jgi:multidrug efflux pump subunit AcrA (membrane-fusion protein)